MKFEQNGYQFSDEEEPAILINKWILKKKVKARAFTAIGNGERTIVLYNSNGIPIFSASTSEEIAVHIDIMSIAEESNLEE